MRPDHQIHVFINKQKYELETPTQTGAALKGVAGIPAGDALFLQKQGEDVVIANEAVVTLKNGDHLHSQPPADYGASQAVDVEVQESGISSDRVALHALPDGWTLLIISDYQLPDSYVPNCVRVLLKLPPTFPDAAPDMFWVSPSVRTAAGTLPRATSLERILGEDWQRFSWHLAPAAWKPGVSTLRDFLRCVTARLQRLD